MLRDIGRWFRTWSGRLAVIAGGVAADLVNTITNIPPEVAFPVIGFIPGATLQIVLAIGVFICTVVAPYFAQRVDKKKEITQVDG